jgi:hypothetical protein
MARRRQSDPEPTLFPFLSVLAAVMGTLILIIAGMSQIALADPKPRIDVERFAPEKKSPVYVECRPQSLRIYPADPTRGEPIVVLRTDLQRADGQWRALVDDLDHDATRFLMFLVRSDGIGTFDEARASVAGSRIEVGYDPVFGSEEIRFRAGQP